MKIFILLFFVASVSIADIFDHIEKEKWNDIEVTWIEDKNFPVYQVSIYFADGALSDHPLRRGESRLMFEQLTTGTNSYTKDQILSSLEFYGTQINSQVTHEYSIFSFDGLIKDAIPTTKMICHLFNNAVFPKKEIKTFVKKEKAKIRSLASNHSELADRAFRNLSLKNTQINFPSDGKLSTLSNIGTQGLQKKLSYYTQKVVKKIYIKAPHRNSSLKKVFEQDCGWKNSKESFSRTQGQPASNKKNPEIYFVSVPKSTQAQIRVGSYLGPQLFAKKDDLMTLSSQLLGGGFTSLLMEELRTNRGFVYSLNAMSSNQGQYGRSVIRTATSNENVGELLSVLEQSLASASLPENIEGSLSKTKNFLNGNFLLSLDDKDELMRKIILEEHRGRKIKSIKDFSKSIEIYSSKEVSKMIQDSFFWEEQTITILGTKSLYKKLKKKVKNMKLVNYKKFL